MFSKPWNTFVRGIVAREKLLDWDRLWDDFTQEEIRVGSSQSSHQARQGKGKKNSRRGAASKGEKKDLSKVKCYACHKT